MFFTLQEPDQIQPGSFFRAQWKRHVCTVHDQMRNTLKSYDPWVRRATKNTALRLPPYRLQTRLENISMAVITISWPHVLPVAVSRAEHHTCPVTVSRRLRLRWSFSPQSSTPRTDPVTRKTLCFEILGIWSYYIILCVCICVCLFLCVCVCLIKIRSR